MNEYYAHAIRISNFRIKDMKVLEEIFKTGYLLSRRQQRKRGNKSVDNSIMTAYFNGMDYISLCDLKKSHEGNSAYDMYIKRGLSLLLDRDIRVINPIIIDQKDFQYFSISIFNGKQRYSDLIDEVQVKNSISLIHLKGMCLPLSKFKSFYNDHYIKCYLDYLILLLQKYNYDVPIYNLDNGEIIKKLVK